MKKINEIVESYAQRTDNSIFSQRNSAVPIMPKIRVDVPILSSNHWETLKEPQCALLKTFVFLDNKKRNRFVSDLLEYETNVGHFANINVTSREVKLHISTPNVGMITELDKEYAKFADACFKDITYFSDYETVE